MEHTVTKYTSFTSPCSTNVALLNVTKLTIETVCFKQQHKIHVSRNRNKIYSHLRIDHTNVSTEILQIQGARWIDINC